MHRSCGSALLSQDLPVLVVGDSKARSRGNELVRAGEIALGLAAGAAAAAAAAPGHVRGDQLRAVASQFGHSVSMGLPSSTLELV
jgi:hypothetical protein